MDVPAPQGGTVTEVRVKLGDRVSEGSVILTLEAEGAASRPRRRCAEGAAPAPASGPPNYGSASGLYEEIEVKVPDIGDFKSVPVIEVHVKAGDKIKPEDPLVTLESDKATMDVPAPQGGRVAEVRVKVSDRVSEGSLILTLAEEPRRSSACPPARPCRSRRCRPRVDHAGTTAAAPSRAPAPGAAPTSRPTSSFSAPARAGTRRPSCRRPRQEGRASSSAGRCSAASASTSAASRRRRSCTPPASSRRRARWPRTGSPSPIPGSRSTSRAPGKRASSRSSSAVSAASPGSAR